MIERHLYEKWAKVLPEAMLKRLQTSGRIVVVAGDATKPVMGLSKEDQDLIRQNADIFVHGASSTNLVAGINRVAQTIIQGSLVAAELALTCTRLQQFVFISTAYANIHLHKLHSGGVTRVEEDIHSLCDENLESQDPEGEYRQVQCQQTSAQYERFDFPAAYYYCKHLTERLLRKAFDSQPRKDDETSTRLQPRLLIVRPSIVGPSLKWPYPRFEVHGSVPSSTFFAALILTPAVRLNFATRLQEPKDEANFNEIPVDIVVNMIIMHLQHQTGGISHATCPKEHLRSFSDTCRAASPYRRLPWNPKVVWKNVDWRSRKLCLLARIFVIIGTSYEFSRTSIEALTAQMTSREQELFPLHAAADEQSPSFYLEERSEAIKANIRFLCRKQGWPLWISNLLYNGSPKKGKKPMVQIL